MIAEEYKIVPILASANVGATTDTDSINITGFHKATIIYTCGAFTGNGTFSFNSGVDNAAKTTALKFKVALGGAAINATNSDYLDAWTDVTTTQALTCTTKMVVAEIDLQQVTAGHKFLTGTIAATAGICHGVVILEARYKNNRSATAV